MMVTLAFFFLSRLEEIGMAENKDYIEVLLDDFMEWDVVKQPQADRMQKAARELQAAIMSGKPDCSEQIAELQYASVRNGFYAGFLAARGLFTA